VKIVLLTNGTFRSIGISKQREKLCLLRVLELLIHRTARARTKPSTPSGLRDTRARWTMKKRTPWPDEPPVGPSTRRSCPSRPLEAADSEKFRNAKEKWHKTPGHHGTEEVPPPRPRSHVQTTCGTLLHAMSRQHAERSCTPCPDNMRNALARMVAQVRTGHWRSVVYLKRIRKMAEDRCWFRLTSARMTRSHVLLHCPNAKLRAAREEAWEGKNPGGVRVLLANPRWERRLVKFLDLSGVGRKDDGRRNR
jgi:hypothetical protein